MTPDEVRQIVQQELAAMGIKPRKQRRVHNFRINYDGTTFIGITEQDFETWQAAYPSVAIPAAIRQAASWV